MTYQQKIRMLNRLRMTYKSLIINDGIDKSELEFLKDKIYTLDKELKDADKAVKIKNIFRIGNYKKQF